MTKPSLLLTFFKTCWLAPIAVGTLLPLAAGEPNPMPDQGGEPSVTIQFRENDIEFQGVIANTESIATLAEFARSAHPGANVQSDRLKLDSTLPAIQASPDLEGLLMELALSTRGGTIRITNDTIAIWGLTDSLVAHSAFQIRLGQLSEDGTLQVTNGIKVVTTEKLAALPLPSVSPPESISVAESSRLVASE